MAWVDQTTSEQWLYRQHREACRTRIIPTPSNAVVTLTASATIDVPEHHKSDDYAEIWTPKGAEVHVKMEHADYEDVYLDFPVPATQTLSIDMTDYQIITITVAPTPSDATVTLTADGYTQEGNSITVAGNTEVHVKVEKEHYETHEEDIIARRNIVKQVTLEAEKMEITINPTPSDATVTLTATGATQSGNTIRVPYNTTVHCKVEKVGYNTAEFDEVVLETETVDVDLTLTDYLVTVNPTPVDATVVLTCPGYTQVGNTITVHYNDVVNYSVSKENYITESDDITVTSNVTKPVSLHGEPMRITVIPTPSDATVTLISEGATQVDNYIDAEYNKMFYYTVEKDYYTTASGSELTVEDKTLNITLEELPKYTITINPIDDETEEPIPTAIVNFLAPEGTVSGNSITVHSGTVVSYTITADDYEDTTGSITAVSTITIDVNVEPYRPVNWFAWESEDIPTYHAWDSGDGREFYTVSETPSIYDTVYDKNKVDTGLIVKAYSERSGITVSSRGKGRFIALPGSHLSNTSVVERSAQSNDGSHWNNDQTMGAPGSWIDIAYSNTSNKFVAARYNHTDYIVVRGHSESNWRHVNPPSNDGALRSICYGNGKFLVVFSGTNTITCSTDDGDHWNAKTLPSSGNWWASCFDGDGFLIMDKGSDNMLYSTDLSTWTQGTSLSGNWDNLCYGNGKYVAMENTGRIIYSPDRAHWSESRIEIEGNLMKDICCNNGLFVAVGTNTIAYSKNAINWTKVSYEGSWQSICYGDHKFVALAEDKVAYSNNGVNWQPSYNNLPALNDTEYGMWCTIGYGEGE